MGYFQRDRAGCRDTRRSLPVTLAFLALALAACGGDEEEATTALQSPPANPPANPPTNPPSPPPANQAPTISGTPATQVMQGQQYSFAPTASDPNGDSLTFSNNNLPGWATFNSATGQLSGTPTPGQVGTYANIRIGVSDGTTTVNLTPFSIAVVATATGSATLTWSPPTQRTDGSPLNDLAGYRVYWGTSQTNYTNSVTINSPGLSSYVVDQLTPATWYFALTAVSTSGAESAFSNVASKQL